MICLLLDPSRTSGTLELHVNVLQTLIMKSVWITYIHGQNWSNFVQYIAIWLGQVARFLVYFEMVLEFIMHELSNIFYATCASSHAHKLKKERITFRFNFYHSLPKGLWRAFYLCKKIIKSMFWGVSDQDSSRTMAWQLNWAVGTLCP